MKMRERRYVKFKVDIYDGTKTKIIDQKAERDFIHYFFARSIILAGKSDCEGELYMGKNIPYTIETLAIEFSRDAALVKLALDVLIELKMIEVTEDNIYKVKNFVKHQNIKAKEKAELKDKEEINVATAGNKGVGIEQNKLIDCSIPNKIQENNKDNKNQIQEENENKNHKVESENYKTSNEIDKKESDSFKSIQSAENMQENQEKSTEIALKNENQEITSDNIRNADISGITMDARKINTGQDTEAVSVNIEDGENIYVNSELDTNDDYLRNNNSQKNIKSSSEEDNLVVLEMEDNKKSKNKKKKKSESDLVSELAVEETEDDAPIFFFSEGDMPPLREGERLVWGLTPV